jgi:hypothetical protein
MFFQAPARIIRCGRTGAAKEVGGGIPAEETSRGPSLNGIVPTLINIYSGVVFLSSGSYSQAAKIGSSVVWGWLDTPRSRDIRN